MIAHGLAAHTPAAVIHAATTPRQCGVHATLASLPGAVRAAGIRAPALIMIGDVVSLDPGLVLAASAAAG
jgi:uroporphyrin-III C-methyltransferase